jgi:hypothetical protein
MACKYSKFRTLESANVGEAWDKRVSLEDHVERELRPVVKRIMRTMVGFPLCPESGNAIPLSWERDFDRPSKRIYKIGFVCKDCRQEETPKAPYYSPGYVRFPWGLP